MTAPWQIDRVQRRRTKGSKLPPNTLCVTRGTPYGNPVHPMEFDDERQRRKKATQGFRKWIKEPEQAELVQKFIRTCREKHIEHLACWCDCSGDMRCHGDAWLELWNEHGSVPLSQERRL